ncbi:MAG TPA: DmsC/YnfH family molybdoenzyme membrane anchor subunit [Symbiobacteriaceae bacterium]|jgi:anaerobic dimethyl sulfoxide reductase subunit C|nr:DmsC/YnfH family molybdoenzyme membrane anchor subunit [Symbiobacteriaceae bacterium]
MREDLPLVSFTLLVQLALGAVALAAMATLRAPGAGGLPLQLLCVASGALVVAFGASLMHLGVKAGAMRALRNLRTSWLSREVLFTGLFTALTLGATAATVLGGDSRVPDAPAGAATAPAAMPGAHLLWLVTLTGLATVFTMSRLYQATIRPAWSTLYTPVSFFASALTLGAALGAPLVGAGSLPPEAGALLLRDIVLTAAAGVTASLAAAALYAADLNEHRLHMAARLLLTLGGLGLLTVGWYAGLIPLTVTGALLLAAGELLSRIRFFALG